MVTAKVMIKEEPRNQLILYCEPDLEGCSQLEESAAMILKEHVEAAFEEIMATSLIVLDVEGDSTIRWKEGLFPTTD